MRVGLCGHAACAVAAGAASSRRLLLGSQRGAVAAAVAAAHRRVPGTQQRAGPAWRRDCSCSAATPGRLPAPSSALTRRSAHGGAGAGAGAGAPQTGPTSSVDAAEVAKFQRLSAEWWDPFGGFRALHWLNSVRGAAFPPHDHPPRAVTPTLHLPLARRRPLGPFWVVFPLLVPRWPRHGGRP